MFTYLLLDIGDKDFVCTIHEVGHQLFQKLWYTPASHPAHDDHHESEVPSHQVIVDGLRQLVMGTRKWIGEEWRLIGSKILDEKICASTAR